MICRNCNTENVDGSVFCLNCGQRIGQVRPASPQAAPVNAQPQQNFTPAMPQPAGAVQQVKPGGVFVKAKTLRTWSTILLLYAILSSAMWISLSYIDPAHNSIISFTTSYTAIAFFGFKFFDILNGYIVPIAITVLFWWRNSLYHKAKKQNIGYCPKCRTMTSHNRFAICTDCKKDYFSYCLICAFFSTFAAIAGIVFESGSLRFPSIDFILDFIYPALCLLTLILPLLITVYMYPSRVARKTGHGAAGLIFVLNIFLGVTVIFWIILYFWARTGKGNLESKMNAVIASQQQNNRQNYGN